MDALIKEISADYVYPAGIFLVMLGLGMSLRAGDLAAVFVRPKALAIGLAGQMLFLPLAAFAVALWPGWPAAVAVGLAVIAAAPGGTVSNLLVFATGGEVALSVSLTAISSVLVLFTIPFWTALALNLFGGPETAISVPAGRIFYNLAVMTGLPIGLGMAARLAAPEMCVKATPFMKRLSLAVLAFIIALSLYNARGFFGEALAPVALAGAILAAIVVAGGFLAPVLFGLDASRRLTVAIEIGVQNVPLAIYLAASILAWPELTIVAIVYTLINYAFLGALIALTRGRVRAARSV